MTVPRRWRVGRTTLYPAGDLLRQLDTHLDDQRHALPVALVDEYRYDLGDVAWATIAVSVLVPEGPVTNDVVDDARTPEEPLDLIEARRREVDEAIVELRALPGRRVGRDQGS